MKKQKVFNAVSAILLTIILLTTLAACGNPGPNSELVSPPLNDTPALTEEPTAPPAPTDTPTEVPDPVTEESPILVDGFLVGSVCGGEFISLVDPVTGAEDTGNPMLARDFFRHTYTMYFMDGRMETPNTAFLYTATGPGGFHEVVTDRFEGIAVEQDMDYMILPLPADLSSERFDELYLPMYAFHTILGTDLMVGADYEMAPLAAAHAVGQLSQADMESSVTEAEKAAVQRWLASREVKCDEPAMERLEADFDGDGEPETLLVINAPTDEFGYLQLTPENGHLFAGCLLLDGENTEIVYECIEDYTSDVTAHYLLDLEGVWDLNNDGGYEVCFMLRMWEWGNILVQSAGTEGWHTVLRCNYGT